MTTTTRRLPGTATLPTLSVEQQSAPRVVVAHPVNTSARSATRGDRIVPDPLSLVTDAGEADASAAGAAATAELERVRGLYGAGAGASLKALQTAQAEHARARAQADAASAKLAANWPPLVTMPAAERQKLIDRVAAGKTLLVRADLPGRHMLAKVPDKALLDVDGVSVEGPCWFEAPSGETPKVRRVDRSARCLPGLGAGACRSCCSALRRRSCRAMRCCTRRRRAGLQAAGGEGWR
jgi:hypothetical protein